MKNIDLSQSRLISTHKTAVRWVDMDAYHHVNNARYFDYMVEARAALFSEILKDRTRQYVLGSVSCHFKKPLIYPQDVLIKQYFTTMSMTSFTLHYTFHHPEDDKLIYAIGESILVCIDTQTGKPLPLPQIVKNIFI